MVVPVGIVVVPTIALTVLTREGISWVRSWLGGGGTVTVRGSQLNLCNVQANPGIIGECERGIEKGRKGRVVVRYWYLFKLTQDQLRIPPG